MSFAKRQRAALCDLMTELGADAPTKCEGWRVADLAAHLWIREHRPAALPGMGLARFATKTAEIQDQALAEKGFRALVEDLRRPGWVMRPLDSIVGANEFFIHHEDVLRANGRSQSLTAPEQKQLWRTARVFAYRAQLAWKGRLVLEPTTLPTTALGKGDRPIHLLGLPSELLLLLTGREADVEIIGEPQIIAALLRSISGL